MCVQEPIHDVLVSVRGRGWAEALCPLQPLGSGLPPPAPLSQLPAPTPRPAPATLLSALKNIPRPVFPGPMGHPESFPDSVSSSQLNVPNPLTEEAVLQGWLESVGKNTECAGTSHPIHHCPWLPVVPSPPCLAENWPQPSTPSPRVLEPSAGGGPASWHQHSSSSQLCPPQIHVATGNDKPLL